MTDSIILELSKDGILEIEKPQREKLKKVVWDD